MIKKTIKYFMTRLGYLIPLKSKMSTKEARKILQEYSQKPNGVCYTSNKVDIKYDLQIIVPAFNAEKYIRQCLESVLFQKTKYQTLVTVVNDGSFDSTGCILENIISEISGKTSIHIEIINQANKGFSGARNMGLKNIRGKYIMFLDSDDLLPDNTINKMMDCAVDTKADIIQGSWYNFTINLKEEHIIDSDSGNISGYPWGKLYKYSVLKHFQFPEGYWFEDTPISYILAEIPNLNICFIKDIVYGYRLNPKGITVKSVHEKKSVDSYWITEQCLEEFPMLSWSIIKKHLNIF